jgi:hypothetical protein
MIEEVKSQEQAKYRSGLWISLALGLVSLVGLIALGGCGKKSADGNTANGSTTPGPGTVVKNGIGMELAYVPAGSFKMGS